MQISFQPGDTVLIKNELSTSFYIIIRGKIKCGIGEKTFFLSDGDFFGEEGVFFNKPNPFTITAAEETLIEVLDKDGAEEFIKTNQNAVFNIFIRNSARFFEGLEPVKSSTVSHIRIIEGIIPHVSETEGDSPQQPASINLDELSLMLDMDPDKLSYLMNAFESLGYVKLSPTGKIMTRGRNDLAALIKKHYAKNIFCDAENGKGSGLSALINLLNKKTKGITI